MKMSSVYNSRQEVFSGEVGIVRDGFSLFLSLLILTLAFSLVLVAIEFYRLSVMNYSQQAKLLLASDLAKSGAHTLFEWLRENPSKLNELFQDGTRRSFSARLDGSSQELFYETFKSGSEYVIKCTAKVGSYERSRSIVFKRVNRGFKYAVVSLGQLSVSNSVKLVGDLLYQGQNKLSIPNDLEIRGNVYATKSDVELSNKATVNGNVYVKEGTLNLSNNSEVKGSVYVKKDVSLSNNATVTGDAFSGGRITTDNNSSIKGQKFQNLPNIADHFPDLQEDYPVPEDPGIDFSECPEKNLDRQREEEIHDTKLIFRAIKLSNKAKLILNTRGRDVWVYVRELSVSNNATFEIVGGGTVWFYAEKIDFNNNSDFLIKDNTRVVFYTHKADANYNFSNSTDLDRMFIYAPNAKVTVSNQAKNLKGAIVAKDVTFSNNTSLVYEEPDFSLGEIVSSLGTDLQLVRWE